jgi:hypothetical protein
MVRGFRTGKNGANYGVSLVWRKGYERVFTRWNTLQGRLSGCVDGSGCDDLQAGILHCYGDLLRCGGLSRQLYRKLDGRSWFALANVKLLAILIEGYLT